MLQHCVIVVPVYNEEKRFNQQEFLQFIAHEPHFSFVFVNDGSTDGTAVILQDVCRHDARLLYHELPKNSGKGEAVRQGMLRAFGVSNAIYVGYLDADLSTPLSELLELVETLTKDSQLLLAMCARVKLLGRTIDRNPFRHYFGRIFATAVSIVLRIPVYDTQCGAKIFRSTAAVRDLFREPFKSRWIFDVEIIARLAQRVGATKRDMASVLVEYPVRRWRDVRGSKLRFFDFLQAAYELLAIYWKYQH